MNIAKLAGAYTGLSKWHSLVALPHLHRIA
jgi:hypothetical protein